MAIESTGQIWTISRYFNRSNPKQCIQFVSCQDAVQWVIFISSPPRAHQKYKKWSFGYIYVYIYLLKAMRLRILFFVYKKYDTINTQAIALDLELSIYSDCSSRLPLPLLHLQKWNQSRITILGTNLFFWGGGYTYFCEKDVASQRNCIAVLALSLGAATLESSEDQNSSYTIFCLCIGNKYSLKQVSVLVGAHKWSSHLSCCKLMPVSLPL
jgi:hypothetical protein